MRIRLHSGNQVLGEYDTSGNTLTEYVYAGSQRIAEISPNVIKDGGFEGGLTGWSTWGTGLTATLVNNSANAHSGNYYLDLSNSTNGQSGDIDGQAVPLEIGEEVTMGGWVYKEAGSGCSSALWVLGVYDQYSHAVAYLTPPQRL